MRKRQLATDCPAYETLKRLRPFVSRTSTPGNLSSVDSDEISSSPSPQVCDMHHSSLFTLPAEILPHVASFLGPGRDLMSLQRTSRLICDPIMQTWVQWFKSDFTGTDLAKWPERSDPRPIIRYMSYRKALRMFLSPVLTNFLSYVSRDDSCICFNMCFGNMHAPRYVELEISQNSDNLSYSLVDFDAGGRSSITFSAETGAVIKERKIQEQPRIVEGLYCLALPRASQPRPTGRVGFFMHASRGAFYRKVGTDPWETTGFCINLTEWLQSCPITPCLAFRDKGAYGVKISAVSDRPPIPTLDCEELLAGKVAPTAWQTISWPEN